LVNEISVHWSLEDCDGVLSLQEIYEDEENVYLVIEYQRGGTLQSKMEDREFFTEE